MEKELWRQSATELAGLIYSKRVSSREVVQAHLDRIDEVNGEINAITVVLAEAALAAADRADAGELSGPLHGVPFTIKENIDCVGSATTHGVPALAEAMPTMDAPVVARMKAAGAIPLARTNLPEMGLRITTDNPLRGRTLNPWDPDRTCGGSSGGEAAALATGMTPIGLGNDIGGSLRNPAYCCGITSLKPSPGRIPHATTLPPRDGGISAQLMSVNGPMARCVTDLRVALGILAGRDPRDPVSVDAPLQLPEPESRKVALVTDVPGIELPATTVAAIRQAGDLLAAEGWAVEETQPPELERVTEIWAYLLTHDISEMMPALMELMSEGPIRSLNNLITRYQPSTMPGLQVHAERNRLCRLWSEFFTDYPAMIGPTWCDLPFLHDADIDEETGIDLVINTLRFITPGSVLGLPSVALPMGVADGLPTGVQVYADRWREDTCLDTAEIIEKQRPPVWPPRG